MSDADIIREVLDWLEQAEDEEYRYESDLALHDGTGNPGLVQRRAPDALAALDRLEKAQHTAHTHSVSDRERRYETALEAIQELCGHMPDNRATASVARIVRIALRGEG